MALQVGYCCPIDFHDVKLSGYFLEEALRQRTRAGTDFHHRIYRVRGVVYRSLQFVYDLLSDRGIIQKVLSEVFFGRNAHE